MQLIARDHDKNIVKGDYHRKENYVPKNKTRKIKKRYL